VNEKCLVAFENRDNVNMLAADAIQYSPDGRLFAWCGNGASACGTQGAASPCSSPTMSRGVAQCAGARFAPDGRTLVQALVSHGDRFTDVTARDAVTGEIAWQITSHEFFARDVALSADGQRLAVAGRWYDRGETHDQVRIFDLAGRRLALTIDALPPMQGIAAAASASIARVAWSPDGTRLVVGLRGIAADGLPALKIFDARTGALLDEESGPRGTHVRGLCFSPDGRYLVVLGIGRSTRVWDGQHTRLLQEIRANPAGCATSADSRYLALGGAARGLGSLNPLLGLIFPNGGKVRIYQLP
jgi:WD40 repeat protein